jgi:hypothetical protein
MTGHIYRNTIAQRRQDAGSASAMCEIANVQ